MCQIMKRIVLILLLVVSSYGFAKENMPLDFIETSTKQKVKVYKDGEWTVKNIKIIARKECKSRTNPKDRYKLNQRREELSVDAKKIVMIDYNNDGIYERVKMARYSLEPENFFINDSILDIEPMMYHLQKTKEKKKYTGEGYFDKKGHFVAMILSEGKVKKTTIQ